MATALRRKSAEGASLCRVPCPVFSGARRTFVFFRFSFSRFFSFSCLLHGLLALLLPLPLVYFDFLHRPPQEASVLRATKAQGGFF